MSESEMEREGGCEKSLLDMSGMDFMKEFEELEEDPEFHRELARLEYEEMKYRAEQAESDLAKCMEEKKGLCEWIMLEYPVNSRIFHKAKDAINED